MAKKKKKAPKMWVLSESKPIKPPIPEAEKKDTEARCQALLEKMRGKWVQPPQEKWGYIAEVYGKWYRSYYYFCALYRYPPDQGYIQSEMEVKSTRLEYADPGRFHLAYFRHTGQWWQVYENLPLENCLQEVETNSIFWP